MPGSTECIVSAGSGIQLQWSHIRDGSINLSIRLIAEARHPRLVSHSESCKNNNKTIQFQFAPGHLSRNELRKKSKAGDVTVGAEDEDDGLSPAGQDGDDKSQDSQSEDDEDDQNEDDRSQSADDQSEDDRNSQSEDDEDDQNEDDQSKARMIRAKTTGTARARVWAMTRNSPADQTGSTA